MKIRRYTYGQSNVRSLRQMKQGMLSPEAAAQAAYAPYGAFAEAAGNISDDLIALEERNQRLQAEEDAITQKMAAMKMRGAENQMVNDPSYNNQMQEDGTPTASKYLEDTEEQIAASRALLEQIQDPRTRDLALQMHEVDAQSMRMRQRNFIDQRRAGWNAQGDVDLLGLAIDGQDWGFARQQVNDLVERGVLTHAGARVYENQIENGQTEQKVDALFNEWVTAEDQNAVHAKIMGMEDSDVRDKAISRIEGEINNRDTLEKQQIEQLAIEYDRAVSDLILRAKNGEDISGFIDQFTDQVDAHGSTMLSNKMTGWRHQMMVAGVQGAKSKVDNSLYARQLASGPGATVNDDKNRKHLQSYVDEVAVGASPDERILIENQLTKVAGYPPENVSNQLKAAGAGYNADQLVRAATRVLEITDSDMYTGVDLGLDGGEMANIMRVTRAITSGLDPMEVAQEVVDYNKRIRDDKIVVSGLQEQLGVKDTTEFVVKGFDDMIQEAYDGLFMWEATMTEGENNTARIRFQNYFNEAYLMTDGDKEAALATAQFRFQQTHALTYINGEAEIQFGGVRAGSEELGDELFESDLLNKQFLTTGTDGVKAVTIDDRDNVKFRNPQIIDGKQTWQVYYDDSPMFSDTDMGRRSVFVVVDEETEFNLQNKADAEEIREIQEQITGLQDELKTAERMVKAGNPYRMEESAERSRDIPKEIALLHERIRRMKM